MRPHAMLAAAEAPGPQRESRLEVRDRPDAPELARREVVCPLELEPAGRQAAAAGAQPREAANDPPNGTAQRMRSLAPGGSRGPHVDESRPAQMIHREARGERFEHRSSPPVVAIDPARLV